jgi:hypothetical protein
MEENEYKYQLLDKEELENWLDFLPTVFLTTPREYFKRHLQNDEDKDPYKRILTVTKKNDPKTIGIFFIYIALKHH